MSLRIATVHDIRITMENAGLDFVEPEGVRRRIDEVRIYSGRDSHDGFFDDVVRTVRGRAGTVMSILKPEAFGLVRDCSSRFVEVADYAEVQCMLTEAPGSAFPTSPFELRIILKQDVGPVSYFVYGDKHAIVQSAGPLAFQFIVVESARLAQSYRSYFFPLWEIASPVFARARPSRRIGA